MRLNTVGCVVLTATCASLATAQSFPTKTLRWVGIATPGTSSDIIGRAVAEPLSKRLGQSIVIDQRGGAGGTIAAGIVHRSEPDGHTLLLTSSAQSGMKWLYPALGFDPVTDFAGVATLAELPSVLVTPPQRGWNSIKDLIAAAKAKPGALNFGSGGTGAATHLYSEKVMLGAGIRANHVPFKGTAEVLVEVAAGRLDWIYVPMAIAVPLVKDGRLKAQMISSKVRMPQLPDVPTAAEAGLPEGEHTFWIGLLAPRKTPRTVVEQLNAEINSTFKLPEIRNRYQQLGAETLAMTPAAFDKFLTADTAAMGEITKAAGIKPQ